MDIRTAILGAATDIERNLSIFNYWEIRVPPCGSPGCAIGLVGSKLGIPTGEYVRENCVRIMGVNTDVFYYRMSAAAVEIDPTRNWMGNALLAARTLRLYADKYHPAAKQDLPASVRHIFDMSPGELAEALSA